MLVCLQEVALSTDWRCSLRFYNISLNSTVSS